MTTDQGAREARYAEAIIESDIEIYPRTIEAWTDAARAVMAVADAEVAAAVSEAQTEARGPFRCCEHCKDDVVHDVEPNQHDLSCQLCDDVQARRAESAEAEVERLRGGIRALADEWATQGIPCECGHTLDTHNGLGCYERLSYEPLVKCDCKLTDDRHDGQIAADILRALLSPSPAATTGEARCTCAFVGARGCVDPSHNPATVSYVRLDDYLAEPATAQCSECGRFTWDATEGSCEMTQPDGSRCAGRFEPSPAPVSSGEAATGEAAPKTADNLIVALHEQVHEWKELSGLPTPLTFARLEAASPAQRTLWEAAHDLDALLTERTPLSYEDEARAYRLREVALQERLRRPAPVVIPSAEDGA